MPSQAQHRGVTWIPGPSGCSINICGMHAWGECPRGGGASWRGVPVALSVPVIKAGIAEVSISLSGQGARGQLGRGCFKIHLGREWQFGRGVGLLSPGTHSCPPCPRWWATWTPWHPTPPGRPAPPWQQGPYLGRPLGPELPAAGRCLPLAQEAALPSGKKEKKGTEKENLSAFLAQPLLPKAPGWCRLASVGT